MMLAGLKLSAMERYRHLVGERVEAHYRTGDFYLSCVGTLACDDGRLIVVQERFLSGGSQKTMRVEIPYAYIVRVTKVLVEPVNVLPAPQLTRLKPR
jgi:hypothetical protein